MYALGLLGELENDFQPFFELAVVIYVAVLLGHCGLPRTPELASVAVHPDDRQARRRDRGDARQARVGAWRRVGHHVRHSILAELGPHALAELWREPARMPELYGDREVAQTLADPREHRWRVLRRTNPGRELQQDCAELSSFVERLGGESKETPNLVADLDRKILRVDAGLVDRLRQLVANRARKAFDVRRMPGHQRVRLHVEDELRRCSFDPPLGGLSIGNRVKAGVCLHHRKTRGVVSKATFGRLHFRWIKDATRRERTICPSRGPNAHFG